MTDLLHRLKTETRARHERTEALLFADKLMTGTLSRAEYEQLLGIHYGFHSALEQAIANQSTFFADYDRLTRLKTPWLVADLAQVQVSLPDRSPSLFVNWTGYELLGALYVAEGSMLGGQVIVRALRKTPALTGLESRFFAGYGSETGLHWKAFCSYLVSHANGHDDEIIAAADRAFAFFEELSEQATEQVSHT